MAKKKSEKKRPAIMTKGINQVIAAPKTVVGVPIAPGPVGFDSAVDAPPTNTRSRGRTNRRYGN